MGHDLSLRRRLHKALSQLRALRILRAALTITTTLPRLLHLVPETHLQLRRDLNLLSLPIILLIVFPAPLLALRNDLPIRLSTNSTLPAPTLNRQFPTHGIAGIEAAELAARVGFHEGAQRDQRGAHPPRRLPRLLVVARDAEADLAVGFEAARRRREAEGRRAQRVRGRQHDAPVVDAVGEGGVRGPAKGEVPFEEVGFEGRRCVIGTWGCGELGGFFYCWRMWVSIRWGGWGDRGW